jgi:glycerol-3-phosphate acyltransferase PlsX
MGAVFATARYGIEHPKVALLSIGEEPTKGTPLVKETHKLLAEGSWIGPTGAEFVGNVEGRDLMTDEADVVVTDGFTGNVALKTLEGALRSIGGSLLDTLTRTPEVSAASAPLMPALLDLYASLDPENTGGAMLLGVDGVCIISHGSSSAVAMVNAIRVARDMVTGDVVGHVSRVVRPPAA